MPRLTDIQFRRLQTAAQEIQRVLAEVASAERFRHEHEDTPRTFAAGASSTDAPAENEIVVECEPE